MIRVVDARGQAGPQAVALTRRAMAEPDTAEILTMVDTAMARDNVKSMATKAGYKVDVSEHYDGFHLVMTRRQPMEVVSQPAGETEPASSELVEAAPQAAVVWPEPVPRQLVEVAPQPAMVWPEPAPRELVLVVSSDRMGRGPEDLGDVLISAFFHTLTEVEPRLDTIIFLNDGIKLAVAGSPVLEDLQALAESGVEILASGTCLEYFGLKEEVAVAEVSNMFTITETMLGAWRVLTL